MASLVARWTPEVVGNRFAAVTLYTDRPLDVGDAVLPAGVSERVLRPPARMLIWENVRLGTTATDDVLFCPSYTRPLVARSATVVATHDVIPLLHPELFQPSQRLFYNRHYGWSARRATLVLTSTEAARRDIAAVWGIASSRIRVVPLAAADTFRPRPAPPATRERLVGSPAPYFLFVGKTAGRRRVPLLVEAFAAFRAVGGRGHRLVLAGPPPHAEVAEAIGRADLAGEVVHVGFVSDDELADLYAGAEALVCPSAHETVSLPIMEAQATGCPVICLDSPGSREITDGAAVFLERLDPVALAEALERLAHDRHLRHDLAAAGLVSAGRFSWDRTATLTLDVLAEAGALGPTRAGRAS